MGLEEFFGSVEQESEGKEDLDVGTFLEDSFVDAHRVLQLVDADGVVPGLVADGVEGVQHLRKNTNINIRRSLYSIDSCVKMK
jgi:hypothetical protein